MSWKIPLFKILSDNKDIEGVKRVLKSGMHWAEGSAIREFEQAIAKYIGVKYCLVFNSGTSALHAALSVYDINNNDEVIVPSFTFIATANSALFVGAKPVFVDIEKETLGLDPEDVKRKITSRTKAIIPVHYGGCPCKIKEIRKIARAKNLILIEDVAESLGASINNKKVGTFGDAAILSFCQNKIITTGEGGAVITNDNRVYEKLKLFRSHGRIEHTNYFSSADPFDYIALGYNFRLSTFQAALGISQMKKVSFIIKRRRENAEYLISGLRKKTEVIPIPVFPDGYFNVYQLFSILVKQDRNKLKKYLASKGIMTKVYFPCVHLSSFYKNKLGYKIRLPVCEEISEKVLSLPMYPTMTINEINYIVKAISDFSRRRE